MIIIILIIIIIIIIKPSIYHAALHCCVAYGKKIKQVMQVRMNAVIPNPFIAKNLLGLHHSSASNKKRIKRDC